MMELESPFADIEDLFEPSDADNERAALDASVSVESIETVQSPSAE
jgi:hypothetical protein